ncbi:hypothetical protein NDU88_002272 [Pleurodeles waltl]|uniref:Uncharacterized protein n=1 Tax=Pleurodeles waltl TaxID=8319 RepID=A0AAV7MAI3_PLEWA|nr:hypothetical protein NDU88_002272 [Pleurodeles waltl]
MLRDKWQRTGEPGGLPGGLRRIEDAWPVKRTRLWPVVPKCPQQSGEDRPSLRGEEERERVGPHAQWAHEDQISARVFFGGLVMQLWGDPADGDSKSGLIMVWAP